MKDSPSNFRLLFYSKAYNSAAGHSKEILYGWE